MCRALCERLGHVVGDLNRSGRWARAAAAAAMTIAGLLLAGLVQAEAKPLPRETPPLMRTGPAEPTRAWTEFCLRHPGECTVDTSERTVIALTQDVWQRIVAVNRDVNERIRAISDREHWGVEDRWDYPDDGAGDCEDIQLLKRKLLIETGLPRRAMRMTVVIDEEGLGHAVMMIRTDRGDLILDNRRANVLPWSQTGYVYVKREGQDSIAWVLIEAVASPVATANQ